MGGVNEFCTKNPNQKKDILTNRQRIQSRQKMGRERGGGKNGVGLGECDFFVIWGGGVGGKLNVLTNWQRIQI